MAQLKYCFHYTRWGHSAQQSSTGPSTTGAFDPPKATPVRILRPVVVEHKGGRVLLIGASLVIVIAGLREAGAMLQPVIVAGFLAILCVPPMRKLQQLGVPEWLSLVTVIAVATLFIFLITVVIGSSIESFQGQLGEYERRLGELTGGLAEWLGGLGVDIDSRGLASRIDGSQIMKLVSNTAASIVAALSNLVLVLLTMIFILLEANGMSRKIQHILGGPEADLSEFSRAAVQVQRYLSTKAVVSLATGGCVAILCFACGVDFPLLWALLAFLFNFIPNIGSIIAAVPAVLLTMLQYGGGRTVIVAIGYVAINLIIGNVVEPKMMGRRLGLSTLVVFLSMVFWGWVWGPIGMLLSVPLTVIVKILLEHSDDFRWVAVLLGSGSEVAAQPNREARGRKDLEAASSS